ncbi:L-threonylcarbamoyladenylate synthase [Acidipropionibacterium jensenii]|uniref:Translation factor (SUA5) n=1 Tax=Acidipropionibacterium jensenii TaxID=1749 RepID=A0A3S4V0P1_9ACTN|nr:L-threonylcarbamoyladenylate synthase [Acidipropionibacterium jensenii]MDN6557397.1 threonylcarbamoyl-AMP synthase [Acidipropionibacterium acidipropionici]AZZ42206.1 threonylcarbamoyl-AMP synthase [Acidipropionibacterium jensenii]MDN5976458.1 threonylcarbamoyl-AMP synthase [Acidipropionibacterium jensenii]MDN5997463.1 threonylcarbamoyl-AMP synthase [Acidipropionibacterium jensenii]MDN6425775.1 threonylcarbamoyl-AMP synthase [Acidipropionibacterium jensenii]
MAHSHYYPVHPVNPQRRSLNQVVALLRDGGLIAYPTDSGYAFGCRLGNKDALERIRRIRDLDEKHHFTLVMSEFAQVGQYVQMENWVFRTIKAAVPGRYTFILRATRDVPKVMLHPKKHTVGVRVPDHVTSLALLDALGEPIVSSTLILPDAEQPMDDGWQVQETLGQELDAVLDSGDCGTEPTTVVDFSSGEAEITRMGAGDPTPFQ